MTQTITVIGGGPGGYVAAIRAAHLGTNVVLVEKDRLGGTCLNRGCIPTKTLFKTAELMHQMRRAEEFAISPVSPAVDGEKLYARQRRVVDTLVGGIEQLVGSYPNLRFVRGTARLIDPKTVEVALSAGGSETIASDAIVLATGSRPERTETEGIDSPGVITSDELLQLREIPQTLIVVGGGVIGLEFASIYRELGSHVILLSSRILKNADKEISRRLLPLLKKQGIEVYNDVRAQRIRQESDRLYVTAKHKTKDETVEVSGNYVLIAGGRKAVTEELGLEALGVRSDGKGILVNDRFETDVPGIYAIGDVVSGNPQLAHVASAQGEFVAELLAGHQPDVALDIYPNCVFTLNEVAHVGATEEELKESGTDYVVSKFNFAANGKALSLGEGDGLVKVIADTEGKLLGVHILGPHANDLIAECSLALANRMSVHDILRAIHAHPTLSETVAEASAGIFGRAIHMAPARRKR
ncbi:MAG: dihydrolipoyl dehydrogenase [Bacillota bacterium]|nr:dihydrolipoyl dehydrogenase [Bacillota bacterium]